MIQVNKRLIELGNERRVAGQMCRGVTIKNLGFKISRSCIEFVCIFLQFYAFLQQ